MSTNQEKIDAQAMASSGKPKKHWHRHLIGPVESGMLLNQSKDLVESYGALGLIADIRAAVGDKEGRLMQDELVEHCRKLYEESC